MSKMVREPSTENPVMPDADTHDPEAGVTLITSGGKKKSSTSLIGAIRKTSNPRILDGDLHLADKVS